MEGRVPKEKYLILNVILIIMIISSKILKMFLILLEHFSKNIRPIPQKKAEPPLLT